MNWKHHLLHGLGVSVWAIKFLPETAAEAKLEFSRWITRGTLIRQRRGQLGLPASFVDNVASLHAFAVWRAAVHHVVSKCDHVLVSDENGWLQIQGAATQIIASQWSAMGRIHDIHPAFELLAKMKEDPFMEACFNALKIFGLEMTVRACGNRLSFSTQATGSSSQLSIELDDGAGKIVPHVFQKAFIAGLIEEKGKPKGDTDLVHCFKVEGSDADWDTLTTNAERAWQASIQESRI